MLAQTAVVLAGGKSSRMGFDKQSITVKGSLLVAQQINVLQSIFKEIIVVTNKPEQYKSLGCILARDELKDFGPLGGIHAGLKAATDPYCYFIACDMPNINPDYILYMRRLVDQFESHQAFVTRYGNWLEPFNAFYSKSLIRVIEQAYREQRIKIGDVLAKAQTYYIEESIARSFSPGWSMFDNINTKEDLHIVYDSCGKIMKNDI